MINETVQGPEFGGPLLSYRAELAELEHRLSRGWNMIETQESAGEPTDHLINHLLDLLEKYEALYDLARAA